MGLFEIFCLLSVIAVVCFIFKEVGRGFCSLSKPKDDPNWYMNGVCSGQLDRLRQMNEMKMWGNEYYSPHNQVDAMTANDTCFTVTISNSKLGVSMKLSHRNTGPLGNMVRDQFKKWKDMGG